MKRVKLPEITKIVPDKSAEIFRDNGPITFDNNDIDFNDCNISEDIMFLQKLAKIGRASCRERVSSPV